MLVSRASRILLNVHGETTHCQMLAGQLSCSACARTSASTAKLARTSTCNCVETNCIVKRCSILSLSRKHAAITRHKRVARTRIRNSELFQNGVPYQALPELKLTRLQRSSLVIIARARGARGRGLGTRLGSPSFLASYPGRFVGGRKTAWYQLFTQARNIPFIQRIFSSIIL